jgi:hypothetical protein
VAHHTLESDLPWIEIPGEFQLVFEAISPTTGAAITSVDVSNVAIYGENVGGGKLLDRIIPALTPEEVKGL